MNKPAEYGNIPWLTDEQYQKAVAQHRMKIGAALRPLRLYGQAVICDIAENLIVAIMEDFGLVVRGIDHPTNPDTMFQLENHKDRGL